MYQSVMDTSAVQTLMIGYTHTYVHTLFTHLSEKSCLYLGA